PSLSFLGGAAEAVAVTSVTIVLAVVNIVVGELAPKRLAMQNAQRWALMVAIPLDRLATLSKPIVWLMGQATDLLVRLFGGNPDAAAEQLSSEELRELVSAHRGLSIEQREMISGALEIQDRVLREILVPRRKVVTLSSDISLAAAQDQLVAAGHSRAPVVRSRDLDEVIGVVHLRDLIGGGPSLAEVARPALQLPDSLPVSEALKRFKAEREQFAVVIDERGGVAGIVTLEDVLEEIVGEIYDETDRDVLGVRTLPDGSKVLPGSFPIHDLPDLGVAIDDLPRGDYTTIAGLVLLVLARIPTATGDRVPLDGWTLEVSGIQRNTITEVRLLPASPRQAVASQS
ncbi:MAG: HlyC/CorC family transporter, partial [Mycobacterium sp.]|nr:HlyC/CorC family transporter [Mycobacterium sp.]